MNNFIRSALIHSVFFTVFELPLGFFLQELPKRKELFSCAASLLCPQFNQPKIIRSLHFLHYNINTLKLGIVLVAKTISEILYSSVIECLSAISSFSFCYNSAMTYSLGLRLVIIFMFL